MSNLVPLPRGLAIGPALVQRATLVAERRLWPLRRRHDLQRVVVLGGALLLGVLLAAWFWVPALLESDVVHLSENLTGHFDYRGHFMDLDLVDRTLAFDYADETPWRTGLVQLVVAILGAASALLLRGRRTVLFFWAAAAVAATFLITSASGLVWSATPLLAFAQFPWRLLAIQALAFALLSGALGAHKRGPLLAVGAATFLVLAGMWRVPVETLHVSDALPTDVAAFELFSGNIGSTVRAEYLPQAVSPRPWSGVDVINGREGQPRATGGTGIVEAATLVKRSAAAQTWRVEVSGDAVVPVAFPTLAFPGWVAEVETILLGGYGVDEGNRTILAPQPVGVVDGSGWMTVGLPPGEHLVRLTLGRSGVRAVSEGVSLVALLVLLLLIVGQPRWRIGRTVLLLVAIAAHDHLCRPNDAQGRGAWSAHNGLRPNPLPALQPRRYHLRQRYPRRCIAELSRTGCWRRATCPPDLGRRGRREPGRGGARVTGGGHAASRIRCAGHQGNRHTVPDRRQRAQPDAALRRCERSVRVAAPRVVSRW